MTLLKLLHKSWSNNVCFLLIFLIDYSMSSQTEEWQDFFFFSPTNCVSLENISVQFSRSVVSDPMDCSTPGLPVHHQLQEFTQTHVHWVGDVIQPSHPQSSPSLASDLSQRQGLFQWVSYLHQVAKVLELQLQHQSFQWTFRTDFLQWTVWISIQSEGLSRVFSNTTVQKHQFFGAQLSL